jgi:hypothetical protein
VIYLFSDVKKQVPVSFFEKMFRSGVPNYPDTPPAGPYSLPASVSSAATPVMTPATGKE